MCGRYVRGSDKQRIAEHFRVYGPSVPDFGPSWNVAPQTFQPVVRLNRDTREREIVMMRWGLIPFWAKDSKIGISTINAKAETVATASSFREAFRKRRCLVPADAFLEWQKIDAKTKQPFAIALRSGEPYGFAGLWERWHDKAAGADLLTFSVIASIRGTRDTQSTHFAGTFLRKFRELGKAKGELVREFLVAFDQA
jgi:putative SOS response-associated peptidase YedK